MNATTLIGKHLTASRVPESKNSSVRKSLARSSLETGGSGVAKGLWLTHGLLTAGGLSAQVATNSPGGDEVLKLAPVEVQAQKFRTVSSPKFTVPLVDTPQTIAVISGEVFNAQGATNLSEVLRNTPGITFAAGEGGSVAAGDSFYLRGVDTSGSIFIDGVRDSGAYNRDTYNLEQVEIAKGPAGADSGRGGASGYINLASKTPRIAAAHEAEFSLGLARAGEPQKRVTLDLNEPLSSSTAVRIAAVAQHSGVPGRDDVRNTNWGVSPSLTLGLGTDTRLTLAATVDRIDNLPDSGMPIAALPGVNLPGGNPAAVDQANFYGLTHRDYDRIDRRSLTARIDHDFSGSLRLINQTKWIETDRDAVTSYLQNGNTTETTFNPATTPVNPATGTTPPPYTSYDPVTGSVTPRRLRNESDNRILSNQTNLSTQFATGGAYHSASAGLELSREDQDTPTWQPVAGPATSLTNPDASRPASAAQTPYRAANLPYTRGRIDTAALYAFDTIQITPRFYVNASLRWDAYRIDYEDLEPVIGGAPAPGLVRISQQHGIFSWKGGLIFKPAANGRLYIALANTSTPPGSSFVFSTNATNANNPNLQPQEARNYEAGAKWEFFQHHLAANLAFYRSENLNTGSIDAVTGLVTQDISQTSQGVEFGLSGQISRAWLVYGGIGYIDTSYNAAGTTSAANDGAQLRFTPRLSANLWTTYALAKHLTIGGGLQYSDSVVRSTSNTTTPTATSINDIPSSWLVNLLAAYAVTDRLTFRINLNNVLDRETYRLNNNGGRYYPGAPRNLLVTAEWKF